MTSSKNDTNPGAIQRALSTAVRWGIDLFAHGAARFRGMTYFAASLVVPVFHLLTEKQRRRILLWLLKRLETEANARGLVAETDRSSQGNIVVDVKPAGAPRS